MSDQAKEELHGIVGQHFTALRDELEEFFKKHSDDVAEEQASIYKPQIDQLESTLNELQDYAATMTAENQEATDELNRKTEIFLRMVSRSSKLHSRVRNSNLASRSFHTWIGDGTTQNLLSTSFDSIYLHDAIKRLLFRRWVRKMHNRRQQRLYQEARQRFDKETRSKQAEYNAQITQLEKELAEAREELYSKQRSFKEMQQRLRKAFMRGVVNLNLEAMDVFNGAQFMNMTDEVEGAEGGVHDSENEVEEGDGEFFVEEEPKVSVVRRK